ITSVGAATTSCAIFRVGSFDPLRVSPCPSVAACRGLCMNDMVRIWYVSAQRLCNFRCSYCVSIKDYAKSNTQDWLEPDDQVRFTKIVDWIARRPFRVGVRLATLGEP